MDAHNAALFTLIRQFQILEYTQAGLYTFFLYDYLGLLPREVESVWKRNGAKVNILYIICRYTGFVNFAIWIYSLTDDGTKSKPCVIVGFAWAWIAFVGMSSAQLTFFLRTYALWGTSRIVAVFLSILAAGMIGGGIIVSSLIMRSTTRLQPPVHNTAVVSQCFLAVTGAITLAMWGLLTGRIIDIILVVMVVVAKVRRYHSIDNSPFVKKVFREATVHFGLNFIITITTIIMYFTFPGVTKQFPATFASIMYRCLACRMIVRMREQGKEGAFTESALPVSVLQFRQDEQDLTGLTSTRP